MKKIIFSIVFFIFIFSSSASFAEEKKSEKKPDEKNSGKIYSASVDAPPPEYIVGTCKLRLGKFFPDGKGGYVIKFWDKEKGKWGSTPPCR